MAAAGTLLSDLDGSGDGDLVQKILQDMNVPANTNSIPPPLPAQTPASYQQMPQSTAQMTMDSRIPTSHMIGNEHPTPADFAAAMGRPMDSYNMGPLGAAPMPGTVPEKYEPPAKNLYSRVLDEVKVPFVVAILFFIFSLSPVRVLVAHYLPSLIRPTGEFHLTGLLVLSAAMGTTFWLLQRVIVPLLGN
jgi:hypothetical protein